MRGLCVTVLNNVPTAQPFLDAGGWCFRRCKPSTGNVMKCRRTAKAEKQRAPTIDVARGFEDV